MLATLTRNGSNVPVRLSVLHITGFEEVNGVTTVSMSDGSSLPVAETLQDAEDIIEAAAVQKVALVQ